MKKNIARTGATVVLLLALLNLIAFVIPFARTTIFWLGYIFTSVAILAQLPLMLYAFTPKGSLRDSLYGFPIARLSLIYLLVQAVTGLLCMVLAAWVPFSAALIVQAVVLVLAIIGCMATSAIRDEIHNQDARLQKDVSVMRELRSRAGALAGQAQGEAVQEQLRKLADDFRFSDPVSSEATFPLESELRACMDNLERALTDGDMDGVAKLCAKAAALLAERNRLCKLNK